MFQGKHRLFALAGGDVLAHATVAGEVTGIVVHRLAADRHPGHGTILGDPAELEVAERATRLEVGAMRGPVGLGHVEVMAFPAPLADHFQAPGLDTRSRAGHPGETKFAVLFPVQVGGQPREAPEARFAFPQRELGSDTHRDVLRHAVIAGERAARVEDRTAVHAHVGHVAVRRPAAQQQVVERLARVEQFAVLVPGLPDDLGARQLPAAKTDVRFRRDPGARAALPAGADEPQLGILFPVPVGRQLGERAEARFALPQRVEGARLHRRQPHQARQRFFGEIASYGESRTRRRPASPRAAADSGPK